ncbi:MAG: hypothetical protein ACSHXK_06530 [Oceanococcus sp.]
MKKVSGSCMLALVAASLFPAHGHAFEGSYKPWFTEVDGVVNNEGREVSLRDELNLGHATSHGFSIAEGSWLTLSYTPLDYAEEGTVTSTATFGGSEYSENTRLSTDADLTDMAARVLWRPFNDDKVGMGLGIGLTVKVLDADITVTNLDAPEDGGGPGIGNIPVLGPILGGPQDNSAQERKTISEVFPMATLTYRMPLFDFLTLGLEASYITFEDDEVLEMGFDVQVRGESVGFTAGWHEKRYDVSDGDFGLDARFKGLFAQLSFYL